MTGDQWRSHPLEVAPGVTPRVPALFDLPSSACRATVPSDFPVRRERGLPVQKFHLLLLSDGKGEELADVEHIVPIILWGAGLFPVVDISQL